MAGSSKGQAAKAGADREATRRVVLEKVGVVVIPRELEGKPVEEVLNRIKPLLAEPSLAWVERGEFTGSKVHAIEAYAGKPGSPDAMVGEFKAPPVRGWQGGARYVQPALPKVEREIVR